MYQSLTGITKEKDTLRERRGSLKMESSSVKTGNVRVATTKTATTTSENNWFYEENNSSARASRFIVHFFDVHCTTNKPPNATLYGGREHSRATFFFLFLKLD